MTAPFALNNLMDQRAGDAEPCRNFTHCKALRNEQGDACRVGIRDAREGVHLALGNPPAVRVLPAGIFRTGNPFKVGRSIVQSVAVKMIDRGTFERLSVKGLAYQAMHKMACAIRTAYLNSAVAIISDLAGKNLAARHFAAARTGDRHHAPHVGNINAGNARNGLPNLAGKYIGNVSHDRTPNAVTGQGRVLLAQHFRPVFYGRFSGLLQALRGLTRRRAAEAKLYGGGK